MNAYIYQADIFCEACGEAIREEIIQEKLAPPDPSDEASYDSDEFPKGPFPDGGGEADSPQHCGAGEECLDAIELSDGHKVGAWLENALTTDGIEYVKEAIQGGGEVAELWADFYSEDLGE